MERAYSLLIGDDLYPIGCLGVLKSSCQLIPYIDRIIIEGILV